MGNRRKVATIITFYHHMEREHENGLEGFASKDNIHLCLLIPLKFSVSSVVSILKGKSASEVMSYGSQAQPQCIAQYSHILKPHELFPHLLRSTINRYKQLQILEVYL